MALILAKNNLDITNGIFLLTALYYIKNVQPCNKYLSFLVKYLGFVTRKIMVANLMS